jgi:hypothetical protein
MNRIAPDWGAKTCLAVERRAQRTPPTDVRKTRPEAGFHLPQSNWSRRGRLRRDDGVQRLAQGGQARGVHRAGLGVVGLDVEGVDGDAALGADAAKVMSKPWSEMAFARR